MKVIAHNKKAFFEYEILDTIEAGIVLTGDEVKSARAGQVSLVGAFANVHGGELYLNNCNITPYERAYIKDEASRQRPRKLLIHKNELTKLIGTIAKKGVTIVPLKLYFNNKSRIKVELGIAKHKKAAGKKQTIKERDIKREVDRELKSRR